MKKVLVLFLFICLLVVGFSMSKPGKLYAATRTIPTSGMSTEFYNVGSATSTVIVPYWPRTSLSIQQAYGETGKFKVALGTTTVSLDCNETDAFSISCRSSGFLAIQGSTSNVKLVVYQAKE